MAFFSKIAMRSRQLLILFSLAFGFSCTAPKETAVDRSAYKAPNYVKKKYNKILVLAKLEQDVYRKRIEKAVVAELNDWGAKTIAAVDYFTTTDRGDSAKLMAKLDSLGVDAVLILKNAASQTYVDERAFYTGSMYSVFGGIYYSTFDIDTRSSQVIYMKTDFITKDPRQLQWSRVVPINASKGLELSVQELATQTRRNLTSDKIL